MESADEPIRASVQTIILSGIVKANMIYFE